MRSSPGDDDWERGTIARAHDAPKHFSPGSPLRVLCRGTSLRQLLGITLLPEPSSTWTRRKVLRVRYLPLRPTPPKRSCAAVGSSEARSSQLPRGTRFSSPNRARLYYPAPSQAPRFRTSTVRGVASPLFAPLSSAVSAILEHGEHEAREESEAVAHHHEDDLRADPVDHRFHAETPTLSNGAARMSTKLSTTL